MAVACHRIGVLEIELRLEEEPQAHRLMDRVSALRETRLEAVIQRVLDELSPAGRLDRVELLELDLGLLPLSDFDDAFLARLEPALRQALTLQLQGRPAEAPLRPVLELLRLFARTGSLPWWADRTDPQLVGAQIRRLLELDPEAWWALLRELQANPSAIERLAAAWDQPTLAAVLAAVLPSDNDSTAGVTGAEAPRGIKVEAILAAGNSLAGRQRLLRLAAQGLRGEALARALEQWVLDQGALQQRALQQGSLPNLPNRPGRDVAIPPAAPGSLSQQIPAPGSDVTVWLGWLESAAASQQALEGLGGGDIAAIAPDVLALLPEPLRSLVAQGLRGEALERALGRALAARQPGADPSLPGPQQLPPPGPGSDSASPASNLADPDELAIDDGGLVVLWPFLDTLLSRLEFVDPELKLFASEQARNQAIALLSFLVEGDPEPPEWRLALAKVLCGLSPLAPWRLEEPLRPEALAECEKLLEAVIAHGGLAEKMEPQDLRDLILRRPAVLTSRTGAWLLRVERRAEDGLLDRFPWGWSWIRLPWMDHPLQVEW
jgi:hypothetical protein